MLQRSGPIPMYQFMWYAPGAWKGAAKPYTRTIYFPSTPTQGRMRRMNITILQLQHHQWTVSLLMQDHLGWSYQVQQITHPSVVWISLLHLDIVCGKPRTNFDEGTRILVCRQIPVNLAPRMHGSVCVSASMSYQPVHHFWKTTV